MYANLKKEKGRNFAYKNNYFCFDCKKNICVICSKDVHKLHDYEKINYSDIQNYVNIINKKNKKLLKTIEFIKLVIQRYNDQSEFGEENLETTSTCIQNENKRDCLLMDLAVNYIYFISRCYYKIFYN